jgi:hypothetical protein
MMATVNELKYAALVAAGAVGGKINELEINWLRVVRARGTGTLEELWYREFIAEGASPGAWNQAAYQYLGIQGAYAKTLSERWYQFWLAGGQPGTTLITDTDAVAALWTERGLNTVVDNIPADAVEITNVDNDGGCYLRLSTTTILSEALVDNQNYRIVFRTKSEGVFYLGLTSDVSSRIMQPGLNGVDFKPLGSVDLAASFLNISLPEGVGQIEVIHFPVLVFKL